MKLLYQEIQQNIDSYFNADAARPGFPRRKRERGRSNSLLPQAISVLARWLESAPNR
jgi:hypothetical protein